MKKLLTSARSTSGSSQTSPSEEARARAELAGRFTEAGDYDSARAALGEMWPGLGARPDTESLDEYAAAEVLLRAGVLTGWLGSSTQAEGAQESAKDLISEAAAAFERLGEAAKAGEARTELAVCYWREGAYDEARVILGGVLELPTGVEHGARRLIALLRLSIVETSDRHYPEALKILSDSAPEFERSDDHILRGKFHNELANVLNYLGGAQSRADYVDRALVEYTAASYHFEQAGHQPFHAAVENNLGYLYQTISRAGDARRHLERARRLFARLRDGAHVAQVDDNLANLLLAEGRAAEAERVARQAVRTLARGGEFALLSQALATHGRALARVGRVEPARAAFERAAETARRAGNGEMAGLALLGMIAEVGASLPQSLAREVYERADEELGEKVSAETLSALRAASRVVLRAGAPEAARAEEAEPGLDSAASAPQLREGFSLKDEVRRLEEHYIELALRQAEGKVSHAAKLLGFKDHGSLVSLIKKKHTKLHAARLPVTPRRRSIIKRR